MAVFNFKRLEVATLADPTQPRLFTYNGASASVNGSTDTLAIADLKLTATWTTTTAASFRAADLILVTCTDGTLPVLVQSVNSTTNLATMSWINATATS